MFLYYILNFALLWRVQAESSTWLGKQSKQTHLLHRWHPILANVAITLFTILCVVSYWITLGAWKVNYLFALPSSRNKIVFGAKYWLPLRQGVDYTICRHEFPRKVLFFPRVHLKIAPNMLDASAHSHTLIPCFIGFMGMHCFIPSRPLNSIIASCTDKSLSGLSSVWHCSTTRSRRARTLNNLS